LGACVEEIHHGRSAWWKKPSLHGSWEEKIERKRRSWGLTVTFKDTLPMT
jgi:hypothetical protein